MKLTEILEMALMEGVYDPSIFKAIFTAGGPGSGKSFVAGKSTGGLGFKFVSSDIPFELLMKKAGLNFKMPDSEADERNAVRDKAKGISKNIMFKYIDGRLGLIIDGTGKDYNKIKTLKEKLEEIGYDTYMIFVNTNLEVAKERNNKRERSLPEEEVEKQWYAVQQNIGKFQSIFGRNNFSIIDNNDASENAFNKSWKAVMKFSKMPPRNSIAINWIKQQLTGNK